MLFNSYEFLFVFLPVVLIAFFAVARFSQAGARVFLALASLFFYGWWDWRYVGLLLLSIIVNFALGGAISRAEGRARSRLLLAGLGFNLGLLGFFKYTNFFLGTVTEVTGHDFGMAQIVLPLGISFFSFTQIAFLIDVYRRIAVEFNLTNYVLFVTYFPHLIAGPVLHHKEMMPQFAAPEMGRARAEDFAVGTALFTIGLAKKVLIADNFALFASPLFGGAESGAEPALIAAWAGALAYTMQIYFDFSGYSDMAIGLSRMFGVRLPVNFASPYKSTSIIDFWRRWHMTLSRFLRDYLYIPLGGNKLGERRRQVNLMATMVLGGLWHGANWTFVVWGTLHGLYLTINHAWRKHRGSAPGTAASRAGSWALTFLAIVVAWVFFRAASFAGALAVLRGMAGANGVVLPEKLGHIAGGIAAHLPLRITFSSDIMFNYFSVTHGLGLGDPKRFFALLGIGAVLLAMPSSQELLARYRPVLEMREPEKRGLQLTGRAGIAAGIALALLFFACLANLNHKSEFLYFQF